MAQQNTLNEDGYPCGLLVRFGRHSPSCPGLRLGASPNAPSHQSWTWNLSPLWPSPPAGRTEFVEEAGPGEQGSQRHPAPVEGRLPTRDPHEEGAREEPQLDLDLRRAASRPLESAVRLLLSLSYRPPQTQQEPLSGRRKKSRSTQTSPCSQPSQGPLDQGSSALPFTLRPAEWDKSTLGGPPEWGL